MYSSHSIRMKKALTGLEHECQSITHKAHLIMQGLNCKHSLRFCNGLDFSLLLPYLSQSGPILCWPLLQVLSANLANIMLLLLTKSAGPSTHSSPAFEHIIVHSEPHSILMGLPVKPLVNCKVIVVRLMQSCWVYVKYEQVT